MGENSLHVDQAMFERYKIFCVLYGCSNASVINCKIDPVWIIGMRVCVCVCVCVCVRAQGYY